MVDFSHLVTNQWYILIVVVAASIFGFISFKRSKWGRPRWDAFKLRMPMKIGDVVQKVAIARWSRTLLLARLGRRPDHAGDRDHRQDRRQRGGRAGDDVGDRLGQGAAATISEPLKRAPVFPAMVSQMVGVGEETGALDTMLGKVADFYEDEVEAAVKALTSILEPAMIVLVGGIVGVIVISMYLPLFTVYNRSSRRS